MSFLNLVINYKVLLNSGYNKGDIEPEFAFNAIAPFFSFLNDIVSLYSNNEFSKKIG